MIGRGSAYEPNCIWFITMHVEYNGHLLNERINEIDNVIHTLFTSMVAILHAHARVSNFANYIHVDHLIEIVIFKVVT